MYYKYIIYEVIDEIWRFFSGTKKQIPFIFKYNQA